MFKIGLSDDTCLSVRTTPVVPAWKTIQAKHAVSTPRQMIQSSASHAAGAEDDYIVGEHCRDSNELVLSVIGV